MIDLAAKPFYLKPEDIEWVNTTLAGMTTEEKAGQLFCVLFKECKPEEFEYVFNILKPGGCMYRVVPTERAIAATQNIYSRSNRHGHQDGPCLCRRSQRRWRKLGFCSHY